MFYLQDLRYAFRQLGRGLAFTVLTVVVLAGGLSVSIFTFSFLYAATLKPLPVPQGEEIVRVMQVRGGRTIGLIDAADLAAVRQNLPRIGDLGAFTDVELVTGAGESTRSIAATASEWNIFEVTRTPPLLGWGFSLMLPISFRLLLVLALAVSAAIISIVLAATWCRLVMPSQSLHAMRCGGSSSMVNCARKL